MTVKEKQFCGFRARDNYRAEKHWLVIEGLLMRKPWRKSDIDLKTKRLPLSKFPFCTVTSAQIWAEDAVC